jgi:hypothetical protein
MKALKKVIKKTINQLGYEIHKIQNATHNHYNKFSTNSVTDQHAIAPICLNYPNKVFFIVACYGLSASNWFAHALNSHPEITCTHSEESLLAADNIHSNKRLAETVRERYQARITRRHKTIDQFFVDIIDKGNTSVCGGVHTHRLSDLQIIENQSQSQIYFKLMNLVRHPVSLVNSGAGHLGDLLVFDIYMMSGLLGSIHNESEFFFKLANDFQLNLMDKEILTFIGGCTNLFDLGNDYKTSYKPMPIQMEMLTSDRDYYKEMVSTLVQNKIELTDQYLDQVFQIGTVNQHKRNAIKHASEYYSEWQPWQKECFRYCLNKSGILSHYINFGYDFSFLPDRIG